MGRDRGAVMRSALSALVPTSLATLAVFGLVQAVGVWPAAWAPAAVSARAPAVPVAALRTRPPASIEFVSAQDLQRARAQADLDAVVLDLERLESLEAAQALARSWRDNRPADAPLLCWLSSSDRAAASAAAGLLAREGCSRVLVAS